MHTAPADLTLTDEQWGHITEINDYSDFTADEFSRVEFIQLDALEALNTAPAAVEMPGLNAINLWDIGDDDNEDLLLTVSITPTLTLTSHTLKIAEFRADIPTGPAAARYALEQIIAHRNQLVQALLEYTTTGATAGPAPKDATILGEVLICPHCNVTDSIVEIDFDTRRNPIDVIHADAVGVRQKSPNHRTLRFECAACGGHVTLPYEVAY